MEILEFVKTKKIKKLIKRWERCASFICITQGHDYHEVGGIAGGKICVRCGGRPADIQDKLDKTVNLLSGT